jgi:hypothetical protein
MKPINKPRIWTDEEIEILEENYPTKGSKGCSIILKRSVSA